MSQSKNQIRRPMWNKVMVALLLGAVGWCAGGVQAEINVTGPGNRIPNVVVPKKGNNVINGPVGRNRSQPFHSNGTFQTLDAEPDSGGNGSVGNIIHPDPANPSTKVFLSVAPETVTVFAGESVQLTVFAAFAGPPPAESARIFPGGVPRNLGITVTGLVHRVLHNGRTSATFTISTTTTVPPGEYQFYVYGLTSENKYTEPAPYVLTVDAPIVPPPPATTNTGTVVVVNTLQSVILEGTHNLNGDLQQVGAMFDNENDRIVNAMPASVSNSNPFPRWTRFIGLGTWTIEAGRGYPASNLAGIGLVRANVVVTAIVNQDYFVAAHLRVSNTGAVTPILLTAGDINNPAGVVMSTSAFEVQVEGATPTSTTNGFVRGVVEGVPNFLEPDGNTLWADGITFTFDVPLFND